MLDDEDRENEGDLVYAAPLSSPEKVNFMATHAKGLICDGKLIAAGSPIAFTLLSSHCAIVPRGSTFPQSLIVPIRAMPFVWASAKKLLMSVESPIRPQET